MKNAKSTLGRPNEPRWRAMTNNLKLVEIFLLTTHSRLSCGPCYFTAKLYILQSPIQSTQPHPLTISGA